MINTHDLLLSLNIIHSKQIKAPVKSRAGGKCLEPYLNHTQNKSIPLIEALELYKKNTFCLLFIVLYVRKLTAAHSSFLECALHLKRSMFRHCPSGFDSIALVVGVWCSSTQREIPTAVFQCSSMLILWCSVNTAAR